jgi:hypothetical protein
LQLFWPTAVATFATARACIINAAHSIDGASAPGA